MYGETIVWKHAVSGDVIKDDDAEEGSKGNTLENFDDRIEEVREAIAIGYLNPKLLEII